MPGESLGAQDASNTTAKTVTSPSHVRVSLKDDTLGLGAQKGGNPEDEPSAGLNGFQNLLGRLNGKVEDELAKEQKNRNALSRFRYLERRGVLHFVSGGYLVGDKLEILVPSPDDQQKDCQATLNNNKKPETKRIRHEHEKMTHTSPLVGSTGEGSDPGRYHDVSDDIEAKETINDQRKIEKTERKMRRRLRREAKAAFSDQSKLAGAFDNPQLPFISSETALDGIAKPSVSEVIATSQMVQSSQGSGGRHAVRQRYIRQKRLATMDTKALNEVCILTPSFHSHD